MIDHVLAFATEAVARSDPVVGVYYTTDRYGSRWNGASCLTGLLLWDPTQDVGGVHMPYDSNWRILIALPQQDASLTSHAAMNIVADRDAGTVLASIWTPAQLAGLMLQPTFLGSDYPFMA